ncbi:hypothetical protein ACLMJK_009075 [Lecanora helva]
MRISKLKRKTPLPPSYTSPTKPTHRLTASEARRAQASLCALLGCRLYTPHEHTKTEVERSIGWHPVGKLILGQYHPPVDEGRLQEWLEAKVKMRPFGDEGLKPGDLTDEVLKGAISEPSSSSHQLLIPSGDESEFVPSGDGWPCAEQLDCDILEEHTHQPGDVVAKLSHPFSVKECSQFLPKKDRAQTKSEGPDMQWKPCSMLDSSGTSTKDLRSALPLVLPPVKNETVSPPDQRHATTLNESGEEVTSNDTFLGPLFETLKVEEKDLKESHEAIDKLSRGPNSTVNRSKFDVELIETETKDVLDGKPKSVVNKTEADIEAIGMEVGNLSLGGEKEREEIRRAKEDPRRTG